MSEKSIAFEYCDNLVEEFEHVIESPKVGETSTYYTGVDLGTACIVLAVLDENYKPVAGAYRYADVVHVIESPKVGETSTYYTGVDLGTACIVLAVLDENYKPVAGAYRYADVVRDGMVVDYLGAVRIVRELKKEIEEKINAELIYAAAAIPPGTDALDSGAIKNVVQAAGFELTNLLDEPTAANEVLKIQNGAAAAIPPGTDALDSGAIKNVVQAAGFELTNLLDEPTAANEVLKIQNGAVVDIGGGTTGISILKDGKVVHVVDEPTGGTHFSLVISGAYGMPFAKADEFKRDNNNHKELLPVLKPVIEKVASIINQHVKGYDVDGISLVGGTCCLTGIEDVIQKQTGIYTHKPKNPMFVIINQHVKGYDVDGISLVGGTCCLTGIEDVIQKQTGIYTHKPKNPMFVTPLGIALSCTQEIIE